MFM
ncbi:hypothetical protein YPPY01_3161, partial [Yersinia pestis PY-01]|jgi:hypothetical protein